MEIINNILFECLWKKSISEIITPIYDSDSVTQKIILILSGQKLTKQDYKMLEENDWSILEIEPVMKDASNDELKNYILESFHEMERLQKELDIISPENSEVPSVSRKKEEESLDSFLN